jgi:uncharacterized membrane protein YtjA (UPF0391 family)
MKQLTLWSVVALLLTLSSCQLIGDIFKAGVWAGILMVVFFVAIIIFLISKVFR